MDKIYYFFKCCLFYLLAICLLDGRHPFVGKFVIQSVFADQTVTENLEDLSQVYDNAFNKVNLATGQVDYDGIQKNLTSVEGKALLEKGQKYINDPRNKVRLTAAKGQEFLKMHNRLLRLRKIQNDLDKCFKSSHLDDQKYHADLPNRIFTAAFSSSIDEIPCDPRLFDTSSLDDLFGGVSNTIKAVEVEERIDELDNLQVALQQKNMDAVIKTLVNLKVSYSGDDVEKVRENPPLNDENAMKVVDSVCPGPRKKGHGRKQKTVPGCSEEERNRLKEVALKEQSKILNNPSAKTFSHDSAAKNLVSRVRKVNDVINHNSFDTKQDFMISNIDTQSAKSQQSYSKYLNSFMDMASDGPGLLVWTDAIGKKLGMRRDKDNRFMGIWGGGFDGKTKKLRPHNDSHINADSIQKAIKEAEKKTIEKARETFNLEYSVVGRKADQSQLNNSANSIFAKSSESYMNDRKNDLKKLIKENPTSAGKVLLDRPELTEETCRIIQEIAKDTEASGKWYSPQNLMWGALIVGGVLLGGAALVGLGMLFFAGTAAGGAALLSSLTVPGLVFGVSESIYAGSRWRNASMERESLRRSLLVGTGDAQTATDLYSKMEEANEAMVELGVALGFSIIDAGAFIKMAKGFKSPAKATAYFDRLSKAGTKILISPKLKTIIKGVPRKTSRKFFEELFKLEDGLNILKKIEKMDIEKARDFIKQAGKVCDELC